MKGTSLLCVSALLVVLVPGSGAAQEKSHDAGANTGAGINFSPTKPESVGFSSKRLERLHEVVQRAVDQKYYSGAVTILARHRKVIDYGVYGAKDIASGAPMTKDTIFRIFSMTKPVTAVAIMILYEQGKWLPSDPITKYIPEFADLKVYKGVDREGKLILEKPAHPPTMQELMTHTAGFTYGFFSEGPVQKLYMDKAVMHSASLQEMIDKLAEIPLAYQPGSRWEYSLSMDIQGYIIEKLSGQSLPAFMEQQIFKPLGMKDTGFYVPQEKRLRMATLYRADKDGRLEADPTGGGLAGDYSKQPTMPSGGGGLLSTAEDYFRLAQMLANGGELNGVRLLSPSSVRLLSANHLAPELITGGFGIGIQNFRSGFGYGYNCAVVYDPPAANLSDGRGTFLWDGAAGTWFWVDPTNDVVLVGMIQRMFGPNTRSDVPILEYLSHSLVYQALVDTAK